MDGKKNRSGFYQSLKGKGRWKVGEVSAYEEHLPDGFFEMVGRRAAINAINENRAMNLPVTGVKNGWVVREMPDGKQERISEIRVISSDEYKERKLVKGAVIHVGKKG
jgi:hypothetical protein